MPRVAWKCNLFILLIAGDFLQSSKGSSHVLDIPATIENSQVELVDTPPPKSVETFNVVNSSSLNQLRRVLQCYAHLLLCCGGARLASALLHEKLETLILCDFRQDLMDMAVREVKQFAKGDIYGCQILISQVRSAWDLKKALSRSAFLSLEGQQFGKLQSHPLQEGSAAVLVAIDKLSLSLFTPPSLSFVSSLKASRGNTNSIRERNHKRRGVSFGRLGRGVI